MSIEFYECVTCGERVNTVEGFNCPRCAAPRGPAAEPTQTGAILRSSDANANVKHNARLAAQAIMALNWQNSGAKAELSAAYVCLAKLAEDGYPI